MDHRVRGGLSCVGHRRELTPPRRDRSTTTQESARGKSGRCSQRICSPHWHAPMASAGPVSNQVIAVLERPQPGQSGLLSLGGRQRRLGLRGALRQTTCMRTSGFGVDRSRYRHNRQNLPSLYTISAGRFGPAALNMPESSDRKPRLASIAAQAANRLGPSPGVVARINAAVFSESDNRPSVLLPWLPDEDAQRRCVNP
jgi:hypothetical protein